MEGIYGIGLSTYRDSVEDTRLLITEVSVDSSACSFPFEISTDIETLLRNVREHHQNRSTIDQLQFSASQRLRSAKGYETGYPFMATAKVRGTHYSLTIPNPDSSGKYDPDDISIQTTDMFELIKDHPSNTSFLAYLADHQRELIDLAREYVARFKRLHPSLADECERHPIVLSGVSNPRQFYAMTEVRSPGFIIHSLRINNEWQSLSNYYDLTISRTSTITTVANTHSTHWIFLHLEDGGQSFMEQAKKYAKELANKDWLYNVTTGMVLTPAPPSELPTSGNFWFKKAPEARTAPGWAGRTESYGGNALREHLREEAQHFADRLCTDEFFEKAWSRSIQRMAVRGSFDRRIIGEFLTEVHRLEREDISEDEWESVDWTKAFPRIDRAAKAWALAKLGDLHDERSQVDDGD